ASSTQVDLGWTRGITGGNTKDTLILRSTSPITVDPTPGTAYTPGSSTINGALVIYKSSGTSFSDTGLTPGTTYYYKFYAENSSYYSNGVVATTGTAPTITGQPPSQTGCSGDTAAFNVAATGTATLKYQWQQVGSGWGSGNSW